MGPGGKSRRASALVVVGVIGAIIACSFAARLLPDDLVGRLPQALSAAKAEPWSPLIAVVGFAAFACVGVPQAVLISALVIVFGGWAGFAYSWCGKLLACASGFFVGRRFEPAILRKYPNVAVGQFSQNLAKRGFAVSAAVRIVPTIPSVLIDVAAGASSIRFVDFIAGTAVGCLPKIALFAFGGEALLIAIRDRTATAWLVLALAGAALLGLVLIGHWWLGRRRTPKV